MAAKLKTPYHASLSPRATHARELRADVRSEAPASGICRSARVLIMDDDFTLQKLHKRYASHAGYAVEIVSNGEAMLAAYKKAKQTGRPFDLVVIDLTVSCGMGGKEAIPKLIEYDPDARAVLSTGYAASMEESYWRKMGFAGSLPKPYEMGTFSQLVKDSLDK